MQALVTTSINGIPSATVRTIDKPVLKPDGAFSLGFSLAEHLSE